MDTCLLAQGELGQSSLWLKKERLTTRGGMNLEAPPEGTDLSFTFLSAQKPN